MPTFEVTGPDGAAYEVTAPEGATEQDVFNVLQSQLQQADQNPVSRGINAVGRTFGRVANAVRGPQDPANADLPTYAPTDATLAGGQARAKTVAIGDEAYADILKTQLGDRFIRMDRDANDYPILVYRGEDGVEKREYVNRPGLDAQDIDRGISFGMPYLASGIFGRLAKGARAVRAGIQGLTAGGVSLGQDKVAQQMGSEQPLDLTRAGIAAATGGAAELLPPSLVYGGLGTLIGASTEGPIEDKVAGGIMGGLSGVAAGRLQSRLQRGRGPEAHLGPDGKLASAEAVSKARRAGLNPDEMTPDDAMAFARGISMGKDEVEVATAIQTNKFGIPTTKGQRTKNPELLAVEKDLRYGTGGQEAKAIIDRFDDEQARALRESALRRPGLGQPTGDPYKEGMGAMVAPTRHPGPDMAAPGDLGRGISEGMRAAKSGGDKAINDAWKGLDDILPRQEAFALLPAALEKRLGTLADAIDDRLTPASTRMLGDLESFVAGTPRKPQSELLAGRQSAMGIDQMRRRLLDMRGSAENNTDASAAKAIYNAFDDWMDDIADKGMLAGRAVDVVRFRTARSVTREVKDLFYPKGRGGTQTAEGRILERITAEDATPESIVGELLGGAGPTTTPKAGALPALNRVKRALFGPDDGKSRVGALVDAETAARTWNDIRMAYWSRLVINNKGALHTPTMVEQNLRAAMRNQGSVMQTLFAPDEMRVIREYMRAVGEAAYKDPNPSGTATTLRTLMRKDGDSWLKTFLQTQQKRELFSKHNVWMSRFYQFLAKKVPANIFQSKEAVGAMVARRATSQDLTPKAPPARGPFGGAVGAVGSEQR